MWIEVDGCQNLPAGVWLCYIPEYDREDFWKSPFIVMTSSPIDAGRNYVVAGGSRLGFDLPKVTHYKELPKAPGKEVESENKK